MPANGRFLADGRFLGRPCRLREKSGLRILETATLREVIRIELPDNSVSTTLSTAAQRLVVAHRDTTFSVWDWKDIESRIWKRAVQPVASPELQWKQLAELDPRVGLFAARSLAADPKAAMTFLRNQFRPVPGDEIAAHIANLDNEDYTEREKATEALKAIGEDAKPALRAALASTSAEVRDRAARLLRTITTSPAKQTANAIRAVRAVEVLERIGSAEARDLLTKWAKDSPGSVLANEAEAAANRLSRRK
jgi:hypothetical protein